MPTTRLHHLFTLIRKYNSGKVINIGSNGKQNPTSVNRMAYLAGLLDGEGTVKVEKWGTTRLAIGMTDKATIYWIRKNFGGAIGKPQTTCTGKKFYVWYLCDMFSVIKLSILMLPFLITKRKRIQLMLTELIKRIRGVKNFKGHSGFNYNFGG